MASLSINLQKAVSSIDDVNHLKKGSRSANREQRKQRQQERRDVKVQQQLDDPEFLMNVLDDIGMYFGNVKVSSHPKIKKSLPSSFEKSMELKHETDSSSEDEDEEMDLGYNELESYSYQRARYVQVTGNVEPSQLSVSQNLDVRDLNKLYLGLNYGIVFEPVKSKKPVFNIAIQRHVLQNESGRKFRQSSADDDEIVTPQTMSQQLRLDAADSFDNLSPIDWPPNIAQLHYPPKTNTGEYKTYKNVVASGFRKIINIRRKSKGFRFLEDHEQRFLIRNDEVVPFILPPPPVPKLPLANMPDRSKAELMDMFCEDLHSALQVANEKLERKNAEKNSYLEEINRLDREIQGPNRKQSLNTEYIGLSTVTSKQIGVDRNLK